jgi:aminopeptidase N
MLTGSVNGVTVNYYYQLDTEPEQSLKSAIDAINTFTNLFGAYPYKTFSIAETSFYQGGMEYPAMVMISDNLKERSVINEVIIHETAHQWWYAVVGNDEIEHAFLDEGLTEYSVVLFYEKNPSYGFTRAEMVGIAHKSYQTYCSIYDRIFGGKDTSMDRSLKDFTSEYEYVNIAYVKGALMFDYLRVSVGEEEFFKGLKKYYKDYSFKNATPDDLIFVYENSCQTSGFFSSWINGEVII